MTYDHNKDGANLWMALVNTAKSFFAIPPDSDPTPTPSFSLFKDLAGDWRFLAIVSNKYRDHDNPPEIIEDKAHREFIEYLDKSGDYPEAWLWHTPKTRWGKVDFADYVDGFVIMSGTVDKGSEDVAERLSKESNLGVSHGFRNTYSDKDIIGWYRSFELSPLPLTAAANPWTGISLLKKEAEMGFSDTKKAWLEKILGPEKVSALGNDIKGMADALNAAGVEYKDMPQDDDKDSDKTAETALTAKDIGDAVTKAIEESQRLKTMDDSIAAIKAKADMVPSLIERLDALEKSDDDKLVDLIKARTTQGQIKGYRASQSHDTVLGDTDALKAARPMIDPGFAESFKGL